jgi:hypothetical protein
LQPTTPVSRWQKYKPYFTSIPVDYPFQSLQLKIWAIEGSYESTAIDSSAITQLTAVSIKEDFIGVVRHCDTIPGTLNNHHL